MQIKRLQAKAQQNGKKSSIFNKAVVVRLVETFIFTTIFQVFISTSALVMNYRYGSGPAEIGWLNAEFAVINILFITTLLPILTKKFSNKQLLVAGVSLLGISMIVYGLASASWVLYVLFVIPFAGGAALLRPIVNTNLTKAVGEDQQGKISGWSTSIQSLAEILTPLIATSFLDYEFISILGISISSFWVVALLGVIFVVIMMFVVIYDNKTCN